MEKRVWDDLQHSQHTVSDQSHGVGPPSSGQRNAIRMAFRWREDGGPLSDVLLKNKTYLEPGQFMDFKQPIFLRQHKVSSMPP